MLIFSSIVGYPFWSNPSPSLIDAYLLLLFPTAKYFLLAQMMWKSNFPLMRRTRQSHLLITLALHSSTKRGIPFQHHMWSCNTYTKICCKFEPEACNCSGFFSPTVVGNLFLQVRILFKIYLWVTYWLHWICAASAKRGVLFLATQGAVEN